MVRAASRIAAAQGQVSDRGSFQSFQGAYGSHRPDVDGLAGCAMSEQALPASSAVITSSDQAEPG